MTVTIAAIHGSVFVFRARGGCGGTKRVGAGAGVGDAGVAETEPTGLIEDGGAHWSVHCLPFHQRSEGD
ncbi:hypothetical protein [Prescottella equi]|uniref:hypothetical protein n=1 Tax=Rhodococcus hoagii TaxID=43767 RepID=UPI001EDF4592|nr:hypothetical protein [Prescottella equi]